MAAPNAELGTKRTKLCHAKRFAQMKNGNLFVKRCFSLLLPFVNIFCEQQCNGYIGEMIFDINLEQGKSKFAENWIENYIKKALWKIQIV